MDCSQRRMWLLSLVAVATFWGLLSSSSRVLADVIEFSGLTWDVKSGIDLGPGPNRWSKSEKSVFVDDNSQLHLKVRQVDGVWHSAEVVSQESFGYGTYTFTVASDPKQQASHVVLGMFTYLNDLNEIDIEVSRLGDANAPLGNFVVQPADHPGNHERFDLDVGTGVSTHRYTWQPDSIHFESWEGNADAPTPSTLIHEFHYTGDDVPTASSQKIHINLWQFRGAAPSNGLEHEVIISSVTFAAQVREPSAPLLLGTIVAVMGLSCFIRRCWLVDSAPSTPSLAHR